MVQQLFLPTDSSSSKSGKESVKTASEKKEQSVQKEPVQVPVQSELILSLEAEVHLEHEKTEKISLANVDEFFKSITEEIQEQIWVEEAQLKEPSLEKSDGGDIPNVQVPIHQTDLSIPSVMVL